MNHRRRGPVHLLAAGFFVIYSVYALSRWRQYLTAGYDLGIFDQAVRRYAHFQAPLVPLKGDGYNLLGDHFHPVLATLAPLYWIWDDPRMLLLAQAALLASSIPVVGGMIRRHLGDGWLSFSLVVGYALGWPIQRMVDFDFHEIAFAVPLLAVALDGLDRGDDRRLVVAGMLLLLVREDMGMVLAMLGVVRMLRPGRRWLGALMVAVGVVVFGLVTAVVLPRLASNGQFAYWSYDALGPDAPSSVKFILRHPWKTLGIFFDPWTKVRTMLWLFAPLLFLPLLSPRALVVLPLLAQRFLSSRTRLWTTEFHYSAPVFVILCCAAVDAVERFSGTWRRRIALVLAVSLMGAPVVGLLRQADDYPLGRLRGTGWETTQHMIDQAEATRWIPSHTCVEADDRIAVHLTRSNRVTLPTLTRRASDFVVLDMAQERVGYPLPSPQVVERQVQAKGYRMVFTAGDLKIWQRPDYAGPTPGCGPEAP